MQPRQKNVSCSAARAKPAGMRIDTHHQRSCSTPKCATTTLLHTHTHKHTNSLSQRTRAAPAVAIAATRSFVIHPHFQSLQISRFGRFDFRLIAQSVRHSEPCSNDAYAATIQYNSNDSFDFFGAFYCWLKVCRLIIVQRSCI